MAQVQHQYVGQPFAERAAVDRLRTDFMRATAFGLSSFGPNVGPSELMVLSIVSDLSASSLLGRGWTSLVVFCSLRGMHFDSNHLLNDAASLSILRKLRSPSPCSQPCLFCGRRPSDALLHSPRRSSH